MEILVSNWQLIREEVQNVKVFHDICRPKAAWSELAELDPEVYSEIINCDGWSYIDGTNKKWWNFPILIDGKPTKSSMKHTPNTIELLSHLPDAYIYGYSLLLGQGIISPHSDDPNSTGPNGSITCHLGLMCPPWNYLVQDNQLFSEEDGKIVSFNHTLPHAAVNLSFFPRVILYMSFR